MTVRIQTEDFDVGTEYQTLQKDSPTIGAIVIFTGLVREVIKEEQTDIFLEHYPGMTEKVLEDIIQQAKSRWPITNARIIHRIGHLSPGENIVLVGVNSPHRKEAFTACEFIMDFLKSDAPFWKKEITGDQSKWVDAKASDNASKQRWDSN